LALKGGFIVQEKKEEINTFVRLPVQEKKIASKEDGASAGLSSEIRPESPAG